MEIVNPVADVVANETIQGTDVDWFIKVEDNILKNKQTVKQDKTQNIFK